MPIYVYAPLSEQCRQCDGSFEVYQRVADARLKKCPDCGKAVQRQITAAAVHGKFSMSPSKLNHLGMTKYVKTSDGSYERTVGKGGPKMIREPK